MRIIISPAKKMRTDTDTLAYEELPQFIKDTESLSKLLKKLSYEKAKELWKCNDKIAAHNHQLLKGMNLRNNLTPALLAYEGIQYQYMAPVVFQTDELEYVKEHLRILSGFYGLLKPFDGVTPYRLEMQAKLKGKGFHSLYDFWKDKLAVQLFTETDLVINLASVEYSKCITRYLRDEIRLITCVFGELINGKLIEKGTIAKMARGEMVRYMAENQISKPEEIRRFNRMNFSYAEELSNNNTYVFLRNNVIAN
jgi:cytoplasmic iron level regulating protein YaaA (DUF328/UPF0246 family)